ncbi:HK97 family phage prohead protease [Bacillus halotolerans]|nr:HK97 family phage prohead protease [Bacillus halotolerans]MEC1663346.1 HK97 family phage prohead protease [Bacillus halotolerans]
MRKLSKTEIRLFNEDGLETRSEGEKAKVITGYALKFNTKSNVLGNFIETIEPGALDGTDMSDVRALVDHVPSQIIGRTTSGTLKLNVDDVGLRFEVTLPSTQYANDLYENIRLGNITNCSFGFHLAPQGAVRQKNPTTGVDFQRIRKISKLTDISVVTYPAYNDTDVFARNLNEAIKESNQKETEELKFQLELLKLRNQSL